MAPFVNALRNVEHIIENVATVVISLCWHSYARPILGYNKTPWIRKMISEKTVFSLGEQNLGAQPDIDQEGVRLLIKQCQEFVLFIISEGYTAEELLQSETLFVTMDRDLYKSAIEKILAISISSANPHYKVMLTWIVETLDRSNRQMINKFMDDFDCGYYSKFPAMRQPPLHEADIFESKEFLETYQVFHNIDEKRKLMEYVIADDPNMVEMITRCLQDSNLGLDGVYLQLQKYDGTHKVRQHIHGTLEMSFGEIHEKLLGMFSIDGRTRVQQGMGVTFNTVWDSQLMKIPKVMAYIEAAGHEFLRDLTSLALLPRNLIDAHFDANQNNQCELMRQIVGKMKFSTRQVAQLFYCGVLGRGTGKIMDLDALDESESLIELAIDLCKYEHDKVVYVNTMVCELLKSLPMEKIINQVCKFDGVQADDILAQLYEKTSDKSILPRLKCNAVKGKVFTLELGV